MEKLKMHSVNLTQDNIARIRDLFPGCVTEAKGEDGSVKLAVDFDQLRQELAESIVEGPQERYHLNWPGKREALLAANAPIAKTLRPCRNESVDFDTTQNLFIEGDNLDALKLLQEDSFDLVLLDCQMPVLDGFATCRAWREFEQASGRPRLPVLALTANARDEDRQRCLAAGMDDYLAKPYSAEALYPVLARWLPAERRQPGMASAGPWGGEGEGTRRQPPAAAAIDPAAFDKIRALSPAGGDELLPQVVTAYLQAAEREFGRLEQGLAVADPSLLGKAAHALKSGSYNVGALQFAACCQAVESAAREGRNGELPALVDELRLAWGPVDAELKDLLKALRP